MITFLYILCHIFSQDTFFLQKNNENTVFYDYPTCHYLKEVNTYFVSYKLGWWKKRYTSTNTYIQYSCNIPYNQYHNHYHWYKLFWIGSPWCNPLIHDRRDEQGQGHTIFRDGIEERCSPEIRWCDTSHMRHCTFFPRRNVKSGLDYLVCGNN